VNHSVYSFGYTLFLEADDLQEEKNTDIAQGIVESRRDKREIKIMALGGK
jgi:hypothetical protein